VVLFSIDGCIRLKGNHFLFISTLTIERRSYCHECFRLMRDAKQSVGNLARVEGLICAFYLHREITYFCSHYFKNVSLLGNTSLRTDPQSNVNTEVQYTLSILNKCGRPSGSNKDHWLNDQEFRYAHVHILINCNEVKIILE